MLKLIDDFTFIIPPMTRPLDVKDAPDPTLSPAFREILRVRLRDLFKPRYPGDTGRVSCSPYWPLDGMRFS